MPSTGRLEEFRDFILQPIGTLIHNSNGELTTFCSQLVEKYENIVGEARRNDEEFLREGNNSERFFFDMMDKVSTIEKRIFEKKREDLVYKPSKHLILGDCLEDRYLLEIYDIIQDTKEHFSTFLPIRGVELSRKTNIPSFITKDPSVLNDAYDQLTHFGYIHPDTKKEFVDIFTGRVIEKPLKWLDSKESLAYFIKGVQKSGNVLKIKNKEHWLVVQKCFINSEGQIFETEQLRWSHPPSDTTNLDRIIQTFTSQL